MKRPVLIAATAVSGLVATYALSQTPRDYAAIYGARGGGSVDLQAQQDVTTTVSTGPAGRYAKPQPGAEPRTPMLTMPNRGTGRGFGYSDYGTVSGGYPAYGSAEFPGQQPPTAAQAQAQTRQRPAAQQAPAQEEAQQEGEQQGQEEAAAGDAFEVSEGFFFDNYTSGTGFGVYGGEAVSSGPGSPLILPSAGNRSQELGFPTGPGTPTPPPANGTDPEG